MKKNSQTMRAAGLLALLLAVSLLMTSCAGSPNTARGVANRIHGEGRWERDPMIGSPGNRDEIHIWITKWGDEEQLSISVSQNAVDLDNDVIATERLRKDLLGVRDYVYRLRYLVYDNDRNLIACYEYTHYSDDPDERYKKETEDYEFSQKFFPRDVPGVDYSMPHLTYEDVVNLIMGEEVTIPTPQEEGP